MITQQYTYVVSSPLLSIELAFPHTITVPVRCSRAGRTIAACTQRHNTEKTAAMAEVYDMKLIDGDVHQMYPQNCAGKMMLGMFTCCTMKVGE